MGTRHNFIRLRPSQMDLLPASMLWHCAATRRRVGDGRVSMTRMRHAPHPMERVQITADLSFSRVVYGMWRLGDDIDTSPRHVQAKILACLDQGITTMDQADIYGGYMAEEILGNTLRAYPDLKSRIELVTKCDIIVPAGRHGGTARLKYYDSGRNHVTASAEASLRLLGVDHIDLLLIHRPDPLVDPDETGRALDDLVQSGKVSAIGVSNFRPWDWSLLQSAMQTRLAGNQIELSLGCTDPFTNGDLAFLQQRKVAVMAWSPLGGGAVLGAGGNEKLTATLQQMAQEKGIDPGTLAVAWLLAHPARILPVIGTNTISRIRSLSEAVGVSLDRQDWFALYTAALGHEVP